MSQKYMKTMEHALSQLRVESNRRVCVQFDLSSDDFISGWIAHALFR